MYLNWFVLLPLGYDLNTEVTRQAVYYNLTLWRVRVNIVAVKSSITYSECVFVDLGSQRATLIRHIVIYGLSGSAILFHIIS